MPTRRDVLAWSAASLLPTVARSADPDPLRVYAGNRTPTDPRLGPPVTLNAYFPFVPPKTAEEWAKRKQELRVQLQVALGLWPMPERTPLNPVVHGPIERDGYTVEKVFFASTPGHYVTGNLYRPAGKTEGKRPGVLCPHGHWANGRFFEASDAEVAKQLKMGAETTAEGAKYPLQARMANLAMQGFVVFHYDMVGYADSTAIPHRPGFHATPADAVSSELRSLNTMGLQTWNSIRALDFLESLPEVDPKRIGVTGASGGGTQTFILCALDDRPAAAFPAVMVSTGMQGGCTCENCSYLRVGTGNVEIAALFAPKPLAMSGADDWTKEFMTKGFPELKQLYALLGKPENVAAKAWVQFPHNYNQPAREFMYSWFAKHLLGKDGDVAEKPFKPVPPKELSVFDAAHPRPADELDATKLGKWLTVTRVVSSRGRLPEDPKSLAAYRDVVGPAFRAMVGGGLPPDATLGFVSGTGTSAVGLASRAGSKDEVPVAWLTPDGPPTALGVVWLHPAGKASLYEKGKLVPAAAALLAARYAIYAPDLLGTGEATPSKPRTPDKAFPGYTFGYNRPLFADRVRDALTVIGGVADGGVTKVIHVVGWGSFGPVAVMARALAGDAVTKTAADIDGFRFEDVSDAADPRFLPGAVKFDDLGGCLALCAPGAVLAYNHPTIGHDKKAKWPDEVAKAAYAAVGAGEKLKRIEGPLPPEKVVEWLTG